MSFLFKYELTKKIYNLRQTEKKRWQLKQIEMKPNETLYFSFFFFSIFRFLLQIAFHQHESPLFVCLETEKLWL